MLPCLTPIHLVLNSELSSASPRPPVTSCRVAQLPPVSPAPPLCSAPQTTRWAQCRLPECRRRPPAPPAAAVVIAPTPLTCRCPPASPRCVQLLDQIFNLKFTSKQLVRAAKKCEKEEKDEKAKIKKAIEKGAEQPGHPFR